MTVPSGKLFASARSTRSGLARSLNSGSPFPTATGMMTRRYSSISPCRDSACTNAAPPCAMMTEPEPGELFRAAISVARSPRAIRESGQPAEESVLENTTLGRLFMKSAYSPVAEGQYAAISS
jgi:hypothetical protein